MQNIQKPLVMGLRYRTLREETREIFEIFEDFFGDLHSIMRRKQSLDLAQTDDQRRFWRGKRHVSLASDRIRHHRYQRPGSEELTGICQGRIYRLHLFKSSNTYKYNYFDRLVHKLSVLKSMIGLSYTCKLYICMYVLKEHEVH